VLEERPWRTILPGIAVLRHASKIGAGLFFGCTLCRKKIGTLTHN
jgi:hypothetical protein